MVTCDSRGQFRIPVSGVARVFAFKPGHAPVAKSLDPSKSKPQERGQSTDPVGGLVLELPRAGEVDVQAPSLEKGQWSRWKLRVTEIVPTGGTSGGKKAKAWTHETELLPGKPVRIIGLRPGRYRLQAADFRWAKGYSLKTEPGRSYHEEILIQAGTNPLIQIR